MYTPPQDEGQIISLMTDLNSSSTTTQHSTRTRWSRWRSCTIGSRASIPFYDGSGQTGRILNVLYLVNEGLLDIPQCCPDNRVTPGRQADYRLLQQVPGTGGFGRLGDLAEYMLASRRGDSSGHDPDGD
ncbi:MAG: hypothetical protein U5K74_04320 [Gemmatimonadaceae bacterium]|nr:hypothetical protein [Gemmatimonadaceae bacterium]